MSIVSPTSSTSLSAIHDLGLRRGADDHGDDIDSDKYMWAAIILAVGLVGTLPLFFKQWAQNKSFDDYMSLFNCVGGGALFATCVTHVLPEALELYPASDSDKYPAAAMLVATGYWLLLGVDKVLVTLCDSSTTAETTEAPATFTEAVNAPQTTVKIDDAGVQSASQSELHSGHGTGAGEEPSLLSSNALQAVGVFLGMALHSIMAGLSLGLMTEKENVENLGIAVMCHKIFDVGALAVVVVRSDVATLKGLVACAVVAIMTPLGIVLGIAGSDISNNANGALQALAAGTFLYVGIQEVLAHEFSKPGHSIPKFLATTLGIVLIALASISHTKGDGHAGH